MSKQLNYDGAYDRHAFRRENAKAYREAGRMFAESVLTQQGQLATDALIVAMQRLVELKKDMNKREYLYEEYLKGMREAKAEPIQ